MRITICDACRTEIKDGLFVLERDICCSCANKIFEKHIISKINAEVLDSWIQSAGTEKLENLVLPKKPREIIEIKSLEEL